MTVLLQNDRLDSPLVQREFNAASPSPCVRRDQRAVGSVQTVRQGWTRVGGGRPGPGVITRGRLFAWPPGRHAILSPPQPPPPRALAPRRLKQTRPRPSRFFVASCWGGRRSLRPVPASGPCYRSQMSVSAAPRSRSRL